MKPAEALTGLDLDGGWHVDEPVERPTKGTGGYSSISYFKLVSRSASKSSEASI